MNETRYVYKTVPISIGEAKEERMRRLKDLDQRLSELEKERQELSNAPLPTNRHEMVPIYPGEEGYEDAPYSCFVKPFEINQTDSPTPSETE